MRCCARCTSSAGRRFCALGARNLRNRRALLAETVSALITALQRPATYRQGAHPEVINAQGVSMIAAFKRQPRGRLRLSRTEHLLGMMTCIAQNRGAGRITRARNASPGHAAGGDLRCCIPWRYCWLKRPIMLLSPAGQPRDDRHGRELPGDHVDALHHAGHDQWLQGFFARHGEMKTTLVATFIQISVRALVIYLLVPASDLDGAAWACAVGWSCIAGVYTWR